LPKELRLIVRLPNWIGDTLMALPSLAALRDRGFELVLVGKAWAPYLLQGFPEKIEIYPKTFTQRVRFMRNLARAHQCSSIVLFTNSFSSALEAKAAGLRAIGFKHEARSLLLAQAFEQDLKIHQVRRFWLLTQQTVAILNSDQPLAFMPPESINLPIPESIHLAATDQIQRINAPFIVLCPFATGTIKGLSRLWPSFTELIQRCREDPMRQAYHWVICPGPKEILAPSLLALFETRFGPDLPSDRGQQQEAQATALGQLHVLQNIDLLEYAALMAGAHCVIANDSGPSHLAAATAQHQITIFGPGDPAETSPWNRSALVLGGKGIWPSVDQVISAIPALAARP
jgi:heptosyltransferase II